MAPRGGGAKRSSRGPAAQRRATRKADRDGDIGMSVDTGLKGRPGRVGKSSAGPNGTKPAGSQPSRGGRISASAKREILKHTGDISMRESRTGSTKSSVRLRITGWDKSKVASHTDGGVSSLVKWLEKKGTTKLGSRKRTLKIQQTQVEGTDLIISVATEDSKALLKMNGYEWAGTNISVQQVGGPVGNSSVSSEAEKTKAMLRSVLERRYNLEAKFLDLSALGQDEELKAQAIFDTKSTASKFFPAMMVVLEGSFDTPAEKDTAILSASLANNDLVDLTVVTSLSQTLPKLQNLDLSNNKFDKLSSLMPWRKRFTHLQHLILSNNPIEQSEPNYPAEVVPWFRNLRMLNNIQVRTEEDIAAKNKANMPFPIRSPLFQDEGGIAENFVRTLFAGFDTDRAALAAHYYDDKSDFSYAINTHAPRDPAASETSANQSWDQYIKNSRNLQKISHLPARQDRLFRGTAAVADIFAKLPKTRHPDLASEAKKWMIEAHIQPGVPDASGQYTAGVDGFMIIVHGEFEELDHATGQPQKKRSFDRTFIVGPGGPAGVRIVSDMLTIRAYGGAQAFDPENMEGWSDPAANQAAPSLDAPPQLPPGITIEIAEQMVIQLAKQTGMTIEYAKMCLDQTQWNYDQGIAAFESLKATLPPAAFAPTS